MPSSTSKPPARATPQRPAPARSSGAGGGRSAERAKTKPAPKTKTKTKTKTKAKAKTKAKPIPQQKPRAQQVPKQPGRQKPVLKTQPVTKPGVKAKRAAKAQSQRRPTRTAAAAPAPTTARAAKAQAQHQRRHQAARKGADRRLHRLPNVLGSCFGVKHKDGVRTGELSYTLLVSQKLPAQELTPEHRIPATVMRLGTRMPTDVRVIGPIRREAGYAMDDGTQVGTIGAFARRADGRLYALTCAHCITGRDKDIHARKQLRIEYPERNVGILPLGVSAEADMAAGTGMQPEFGEFDAALAELSDDAAVTAPALLAHVRGCAELPVYEPPAGLSPEELADLLSFTPVQGWGAAANGMLRGQIEGVMVFVQGQYFDLMITDPGGQGLTTVGDSGLIWTGPLGKAYGIHMAGDGPSGSASAHTFACFAHRPARRYGLTLLSP
ncbi:MAG: hypothetical protein B7Z37_21135 [Verrucomicrobia bacterium 12-59-8]|nr:MAG: hypothetical protein B7Z37_21135 [Verrucomicrobia bacterium 12-59-8]